jgi:hypothetical protein
VLAAGCRSASAPLKPWPKLDLEDQPDANVSAPAWYTPKPAYSPWPLGPEPKHATDEWRRWCALQYNPRDLIRPLTAAPAIDGELGDAAWQQTALKAPFVGPTGAKAAPSTTISIAYDKDNLYVAGFCEEPYPTQIEATGKTRDAMPRQDDRVEISLAPNWKARTFAVYSIQVNANGTVADALGSDPAWSADIKAAATIGEKGWAFELSVPLSAFGMKSADPWGAVWAAQFIRTRAAGGTREVSAWTRIADAAGGASAWGHLIFKGLKPEEIKEPAPPAPEPGTEKKDNKPDPGKPGEADKPGKAGTGDGK